MAFTFSYLLIGGLAVFIIALILVMILVINRNKD